jgi:hypothetical protein
LRLISENRRLTELSSRATTERQIEQTVIFLTADRLYRSQEAHVDLGAGVMMEANPSCGLKILFLGAAALLPMFVPRPSVAQDVRTLCQPLEIHNGTPQEEPCLKFGSLVSVAKRDGGVLTLKLNNGKTRIIRDSKECEDPTKPESEGRCVGHALVGYIDDRQFLVHVQPWECGYPLLVSRRTGEEMKLENWPNLSPSKKRFVVVTPFEECVVHDTIAIFSLESDPPRLEWRFTPDDDPHEDYHFDGWDSENRVRLRAIVESAEGKRKEMATDLKLTAQGWQIKRSSGKYSLGVTGQVKPERPASQPGNTAPAAPPGR